MKILFLSHNFPPEVNAGASRVYERARYWVDWGHSVTVLTPAPNKPAGKLFEGYENRWYQTEVVDGIRVVRVKTLIGPNKGTLRRGLDYASFMCSSFFFGLFQQQPDIVVATSPHLLTVVSGLFLAGVKRKPFTMELADLWPASIIAVDALDPGPVIKRLEELEMFLYRRSDQVVALTHAFKRDLVSRGISGSKIEVVRNGVELGSYAPRPKDVALNRELGLQGKFVLGYLGTHGMAHGLGNVLDAAVLLADEADIHFLLVGDGAEKDALVERAKREKIENVTFLPLQPKSEIARYWSLCDIALVHLRNAPTFATVIPSKIFEAMSMGVPTLLVCPSGESREVLEETDSGVWVEAGNPELLARKVRDLHAAPEMCARVSRNAIAAAPSHSRRRQAREFLDSLGRSVSGAATR